jgi:hypothetical protein
MYQSGSFRREVDAKHTRERLRALEMRDVKSLRPLSVSSIYMKVPYSSLCISLVRGGVPVRQIVFFLRAVTIPEHYKSGLARRREVQDLPSIKATTTLRSGTTLHELIADSAR